MKINRNSWIGLLVVAIVIAAGFTLISSNESSTNVENSTESSQTTNTQELVINSDGTVVAYNGVVGESALATLQSLTDVRVEESSFGVFVTGIGDVDADSSENFWSFMVNGEMATVGAGEYISQEGDKIEWQLTELQ